MRRMGMFAFTDSLGSQSGQLGRVCIPVVGIFGTWHSRKSMLTEQTHAFVDQLAKALELIGVAIIVGGIVLATLRFVRDGRRAHDWQSAYPNYRSNIGRGILLGLELLVGADII